MPAHIMADMIWDLMAGCNLEAVDRYGLYSEFHLDRMKSPPLVSIVILRLNFFNCIDYSDTSP